MDYYTIIFWFLLITCGSVLFSAFLRRRGNPRGWVFVYSVILLCALIGRVTNRPNLILAALGLWFAFVLAPSLLWKLYSRRSLQGRYTAARRLAQILALFHPFDGWREQPVLMRAMELAHQGDMAGAIKILERARERNSAISLAATLQIFKLANRWEELLAWLSVRSGGLNPAQTLSTLLRAKGEIGDVPGLILAYEQNRNSIAAISPASLRDQCRLFLFAFCGRREAVARIFQGGLCLMADAHQKFWLATADLAAGSAESARRQFEALLPTSDAVLRAALERRLEQSSAPPPLISPAAAAILRQAETDQGHDEAFSGTAALFSKHGLATLFVILLNLAMFAVEMRFGGATDFDTLKRLGAFWPQAFHEGQKWRVLTAMFMHFGPLHLAMNLIALAALGPFVERTLRWPRYLILYFTAGVGSMLCVLYFSSHEQARQIIVGASGSVMGLVGATGALMLRAWLQTKAAAARQRLTTVIIILVMQTTFDAAVPEVSMTAHLSGAIIGFVTTLLLSFGLKPAAD